MYLVLTALLVVIGCGDDSSTTTPDASADSSADGASPLGSPAAPPAEPAPPAIPWLDDGDPPIAPPAMTPCAEGWTEETHADGIVECFPWPAARPSCPPAEARFVGAPDCVLVGPPCPTETFSTDVPSGRTAIYVDDDSTGRRDGSMASPFADLDEALAVAVPGATIVLADGAYTASGLAVDGDIELLGTCPSGVSISGAGAEALMLSGDGPTIRRVTIDNDAGVGVAARGTNVRLENVVVTGTASHAVVVEGGSATLRGLSLRDVASGGGAGVRITAGATVDAQRIAVDGAQGPGLEVVDSTLTATRVSATRLRLVTSTFLPAGVVVEGAAAEATLTEVAVEDAAAGLFVHDQGTSAVDRFVARNLSEPGILVQDRAVVDARRVSVHDAGTDAVGGFFSSQVSVSDLVVRGGRSGAAAVRASTLDLARAHIVDVTGGAVVAEQAVATIALSDVTGIGAPGVFGVAASSSAGGTGERIALRGFLVGVMSSDRNSRLELSDVHVSDAVFSTRSVGYSVLARERGELVMDRVVVEDFIDYGIRAFDAAEPVLRDVVVRRGSVGGAMELIDYPHRGPMGIRISRSSTGIVERASVTETFVGYVVSTSGTLEGRDLSFADPLPGLPGPLSSAGAFLIYGESSATLERVRADAPTDFGLAVQESTVRASDISVRDVSPQPDIQQPVGIFANRADVILNRAAVESLAGTGILVHDASFFDAYDLAVRDIRAAECDTCDLITYGSAMVIAAVPAVALERFHLAGSELCGVHFVDGDLDMTEGLIEGHPIGLCIEVRDYDLSRVMNGVRFVDNETNLETTELPVPEIPVIRE